ncbi:MAG: class I SAM-dependent methyltransferase [Acidobacteriota bacterium]|nr:class I SAM-dependent methyltransferase [Acidobacteriota bacterium]
MSTIQQDFDRIALATAASSDGSTQNDHYHNFLLRHLPSPCQNVLEIGCGTGVFARRLAERSEHVLALDLSPEMIRIARERSVQFPNIEFEVGDVCNRPLTDQSFDCMVTIATLHHLPFAEILLKMKTALKPGGVLLVLDLFEPARISDSLLPGLSDSLLNLLAIPVSVGLRLLHHGHLLSHREVRDALGCPRTPRFLPHDARGTCPLRRHPPRRKDQEAPLVAVFDCVEKALMTLRKWISLTEPAARGNANC